MFRHRDGGARRAGRLSRRAAVAGASVACLGVVLAACGGGGGGTNAASPSASASGTPKVGGTLSFAEFSPPVGLDPLVSTGAGVTGLIETTAVYDTLMRYNYKTGKYDPGVAESATPNADFTQWTIKLRPNVKFSDGTDYDADAVVFGLNRFRGGLNGAPPCAEVVGCPGPTVMPMGAYIKDLTAVDKTTVRVDLMLPWASFPVALASEPGLIPSPTALKKCNASAPANQCAFNTAPVGAGPFMVTSFKPGEAITMVRNPNYWGGQVYLDGLNFVSFKDGGGPNTFSALKAGTVQAAFLRDPVTVAAAHDAKYSGISNPAYLGTEIMMNIGTPTTPTHDLTVRQAVAAAIDPKVVSQRAFDGKGTATAQLLTPDFRWYPDVPGPQYDPAKAKQLVAQAKAEGWDGKIRLLANNAPSSVQMALALQAMLESAGMTVQADTTKDTAATTAMWIKKDFDLWVGGNNFGNDDTGTLALASPLLSTSPSNRPGIKDPALDKGIKDLFAAGTDDAKKAAWKEISTEFDAQLPILPLMVPEEFIATSADVHGMVQDLKTSVHLDKAWIG